MLLKNDYYYGTLYRYDPYDIVQRGVRPIVLFEDGDDGRVLEEGAHGLILPKETDPDQAVPLAKVDGRRRILGLDPDHARFHLGRGPEIVLPHLQKRDKKQRKEG